MIDYETSAILIFRTDRIFLPVKNDEMRLLWYNTDFPNNLKIFFPFNTITFRFTEQNRFTPVICGRNYDQFNVAFKLAFLL